MPSHGPLLKHKMKILLVEDYQPLRESLADGLTAQGNAVDTALDGEEGLWYASENNYDVIILDIMLPKLDGYEVLQSLRTQGNNVPVLVLSAKGEIDDRIRGLDIGCDDYLVKPFAFAELVARLRALVRRRHDNPKSTIQIEDLQIDTAARRVTRQSKDIPLSKKEFALLECLALRTGHIVTRSEILESLYSFDDEVESNVVEVFIRSLRRKIDDPFETRLIHTKRGHGYFLGVMDK